jgi:hypothetical protein
MSDDDKASVLIELASVFNTLYSTNYSLQEAVEHYEAAAKALRYIFDKAGDNNWLDVPVISFVKTLVAIARRASACSQRDENSGDVLKRAGAEIRSIRATASRNSDSQNSKVYPCMALLSLVFLIRFPVMGAAVLQVLNFSAISLTRPHAFFKPVHF